MPRYLELPVDYDERVRVLHGVERLHDIAEEALLQRDRAKREAFVRADQDILCSCRRPAVRHPHDPFERWLHVLCDGTRVKL